jgi:predicted ATPase
MSSRVTGRIRQIPESLRQLVERQLERLGPEERQIVEAASVAGVEFSAAAVAAGVGGELVAVEAQCEELARRHFLLRPQGVTAWPDGTVAAQYRFLHGLYQEVLYAHVPAGRRGQLHQRIGKRKEAAYGNQAREVAAELAIHLERGREYCRAIYYLEQAGKNALQRHAFQEAIILFTKGLELLKPLPATPERVEQELRLQLALGVPLMATIGWAAPELGASYAQARALCQQLGDTPRLFRALYGLWVFHYTRAELHTAQELAEQLLILAEQSQKAALRMEAHHVLGNTLHRLGELPTARIHLEQGIALYDPQQHRSHASLYGLDDGVTGLGYTALVLWALGFPDQALQRTQEMLILARELSHPPSLAWAYNTAAWLHLFRREGQLTQAQAEAGIALCTEHGFAQLLAVGTILRGWAFAAQGKEEEGIVQMRHGLTACQDTGAQISRPRYLAMLAEVYGNMGQATEGSALLAEAVTVAQTTGEQFCAAEYHRLMGNLALTSKVHGAKTKARNVLKGGLQSTEEKAETYFHQAITLARGQDAKSLELRAVTSLSRLWQQQGKKEEARQMLAEIYGWFTEGFDTKDLQEARTLLEEF